MPVTPSAAARTTVFCAVWSKDPDRWELLRGHQENLEQQSVAVAPMYVFDDGDQPPDWVRGRLLLAPDPLTIYQAWSLATQFASTEFLMNLNLDDRLVPEAIQVLYDALAANKADVAGGEWRVVASQSATDAAGGAGLEPASSYPFSATWPPPSADLRLGSGSGDRQTLGPATIWRRRLHERVAFPTQFDDGTPIRVVGDVAWWTAAEHGAGARFVRVPVVIGHYHSHPASQAEFRESDDMTGRHFAAVPHPTDGVRVIDREA